MTDPCEIDVLYRDERLCALHKPSGIMVHRTNISTDRVFLADRLREHLGQRVWTVHRLDRATSGVLLFALDVDAAADIGRQFEAGTVGKRYLAVVRGWLDDQGTVDRALRGSRNRMQDAITHYRCLARTELPIPVAPHDTARYSLAELVPETGRMHQIRRHLNHISHPVIGDVNHGDRRHNRLFRARFSCHRLLLHAAELGVDHPASAERLAIRAHPPAPFRGVIEALGWRDALTDRADL